MSNLAVLTTLDRFEAASPAERLALSGPVAELAGPEFRACSELVGNKQRVAVDHTQTGLRFILVPGGRFSMGLTDRDIDEVRAFTDFDSGVVQARLQQFEATCTPVREVTVAPFLLTSVQADMDQLLALTSGKFGATTATPDEALAFMQMLRGLRLPSESELEYVGREGGAVSFVDEGNVAWKRDRRWPKENAWGFRTMSIAAWAADEWHPNYEGAPGTPMPWTDGGAPGVYRGCLLYTPEDEDQLLFGLAAVRGRYLPSDDEWDVAFRLALTLRI